MSANGAKVMWWVVGVASAVVTSASTGAIGWLNGRTERVETATGALGERAASLEATARSTAASLAAISARLDRMEGKIDALSLAPGQRFKGTSLPPGTARARHP